MKCSILIAAVLCGLVSCDSNVCAGKKDNAVVCLSDSTHRSITICANGMPTPPQKCAAELVCCGTPGTIVSACSYPNSCSAFTSHTSSKKTKKTPVNTGTVYHSK
ncbi:hypothetical protein BC830DRAFT_1114040 [Chytriomyces sp. MP71]|nr:hypothetical protein BC830DRAFT_1114040 [Chytriomyces sp. MP71]